MSVICGKCHHTRSPADNAPEWQCPACGAAYAKVNTPPTPSSPTNLRPSKKQPTPKVFKPQYIVLGLAAVGIFATAYFMGQNSATPKPPSATPTPELSANSHSTTPQIRPAKPSLDIDEYKSVLLSHAKDPSSVMFSNLKWGTGEGGNSICGYYNAKNSFGGYTGKSIFAVTETIMEGESSRLIINEHEDQPIFNKVFLVRLLKAGCDQFYDMLNR